MRHWDHPESNSQFGEIRRELIESDFLEKVDTLSSALTKAEPAGKDALANVQNRHTSHVIELAIKLFENPSSEVGKPQRLEFQLVYYLLEFLQKYHQPIINKIVHEDDRHESFQKKLTFMRSYLNFFRTMIDSHMYFMKAGCDTIFDSMADSSKVSDPDLHKWIIKVTHEKIQHDEDRMGILTATPNMNLWMGQACWKCGQISDVSCHRPKGPEEYGDWLLVD
jgi:hypothetical protein